MAVKRLRDILVKVCAATAVVVALVVGLSAVVPASDLKLGSNLRLLVGVFTFLWSLLFIIPGIIASYSYAMTPYILAEHPEIGVMDAINASKKMMSGNKFRLFCLHFSFLGWDILSLLTFGILRFWLQPYKETANAAFYREISGTAAQTQNETYSTDGWSYGSSWNV